MTLHAWRKRKAEILALVILYCKNHRGRIRHSFPLPLPFHLLPGIQPQPPLGSSSSSWRISWRIGIPPQIPPIQVLDEGHPVVAGRSVKPPKSHQSQVLGPEMRRERKNNLHAMHARHNKRRLRHHAYIRTRSRAAALINGKLPYRTLQPRTREFNAE